MCIFTTLISNAQTELRSFINPITGKSYGVSRSASLKDVPAYYREAAVYGKWDLLNLPEDMANQAYLDQKKEGGVWGVAIRNMFTNNNDRELNDYIPGYGGKRTIIYQNPTTIGSSKRYGEAAYWAQQLADFGISGVVTSLLVGSLIFFIVWKIFLSKKSKENRRIAGRILKRTIVVCLILFTSLLILSLIIGIVTSVETIGVGVGDGIAYIIIIGILVWCIILLCKSPKKRKNNDKTNSVSVT